MDHRIKCENCGENDEYWTPKNEHPVCGHCGHCRTCGIENPEDDIEKGDKQ